MWVARSIAGAVAALTLLVPASGLARPPGASAFPPPVVPTIFADVAGPDALILESLNGGRWEYACSLPCHVALPVARRVRVRGDGIRASRTLSLDASPGQIISIGAAPGGSPGGYAGGIVATSIGGGGMLVGTFVWLAGAICGIGGNSCAGSGLETAGIVTFSAGTAVLVGGIVLLLSNPRSSAAQFPAGTFPEPPPRADLGWWPRAPVWERDAERDRLTLPAAAVLPVFSRVF